MTDRHISKKQYPCPRLEIMFCQAWIEDYFDVLNCSDPYNDDIPQPVYSITHPDEIESIAKEMHWNPNSLSKNESLRLDIEIALKGTILYPDIKNDFCQQCRQIMQIFRQHFAQKFTLSPLLKVRCNGVYYYSHGTAWFNNQYPYIMATDVVLKPLHHIGHPLYEYNYL